MRALLNPVTKAFEIKEIVQTEITKEDFISISENKIASTVVVEIGKYTEDNRLIEQETIGIQHEYYQMLISENPAFAPDKPYQEYREVDLWYVIDLIRAEQ
jgi:hypothetical protein